VTVIEQYRTAIAWAVQRSASTQVTLQTIVYDGALFVP